MNTLLLLETATTLYLCGLIWTVQVTHYPTFRFIPSDAAAAFHVHHTGAMTRIVLLPMVLELGLSLASAYFVPGPWRLLSLLAVIGLWALTFGVSVPIHSQLNREWKKNEVEKLIRTNWLRTGLWSLRGAGLIVSWLI